MENWPSSSHTRFYLRSARTYRSGFRIHENDFYDITRNLGGSLIESVTLIDEYDQVSKQRRSRCYSEMTNPGEFNREVNDLHKGIGEEIIRVIGAILR